MRLIDQINKANYVAVEKAEGACVRVKTAADFRQILRATPQRYILDDTATKLCAELAVLDTKLLYKSFDVLRLPAERFWVEWRERPKFEALELAQAVLPGAASIPPDSRGGILIEASPGARSGSAWLFSGEKDDPEFFPLYLQFSTEAAMPPPRRAGALSTFSISNSTIPHLKPVLDHCLLSVEASWANHYSRSMKCVEDANRAIEGLANKLWLDWPFVAAFLLLYQTPSVFRARPSDLRTLNSARAKRGKADLLEHVEIVASLCARGPGGPAASGARGLGGKRLHHVRGHLVRRGDNLHWRSPHLRGDGALGVIATRTVRVKA